MSLKMKQSNGVTFLEGAINSETEKQFRKHLEFLLTYTNAVTINIDKTSFISRNGLKVIEDLFSLAKQTNKKFSVVGYGCKDIYDSINFSEQKAA